MMSFPVDDVINFEIFLYRIYHQAVFPHEQRSQDKKFKYRKNEKKF